MTKIQNYVSEHAAQIRNAALTGLAAVVLAAGVTGCDTASRRRAKLSLLNFEYEDVVTNSDNIEVQTTALNTPPKASTSVDAPAGKGFGFNYNQ